MQEGAQTPFALRDPYRSYAAREQ